MSKIDKERLRDLLHAIVDAMVENVDKFPEFDYPNLELREINPIDDVEYIISASILEQEGRVDQFIYKKCKYVAGCGCDRVLESEDLEIPKEIEDGYR